MSMNALKITRPIPDLDQTYSGEKRYSDRRPYTYLWKATGYAFAMISAMMTIGQTAIAEDAYRILLTNDDGIEAPGILALAEELGKTYEILVCAPAENQSGSGSTSTLRRREADPNTIRPREILLKNRSVVGASKSYSLEGTPSDAVRFGLRVFGKSKPVDLVVSGINRGENLGGRARTSGTIGAAFTGLAAGIPSIAFSGDRSITNYTQSAQIAAKIVREAIERQLPKDVLLSVNIPGGEIAGVIASPMALGDRQRASRTEPQSTDEGDLIFQLPARPREGSLSRNDAQARESRRQRGTGERAAQTGGIRRGRRQPAPEPGNHDAYYFRTEKRITITPLKLDWTDYQMISDLNHWNIHIPRRCDTNE